MSNRLDTIKELLGDTDDFKSIAVQQSAPPRTVGILGVLTFALIPILGFSLMFVPWQQVSTGNGKVIAYAPENRLQTIEAPVSGRLARWLVHEGQVVKKGAALVELADNDPEILSRLERQYEAMKVKLSATEDALRVSKINLGRQRDLEKKGLSSRRAYELALLEVSKFESEVSSARASLADTEVKLSRQASQTIQADRDGIVTRILAPQGGIMVSAGDSLAVLVPDTDDRAVELYVTGNDLPLITKDRKVRLQFEGWPAVQFTGWPSVAIGTFGGVVKFVDQADDGEGNYRVLVFPDPTEPTWPSGLFLRQGVRAIGWIMLDRVSLGWELWRRLNGFPVTVSNQEKAPSSKK